MNFGGGINSSSKLIKRYDAAFIPGIKSISEIQISVIAPKYGNIFFARSKFYY